MYRMGKEEIDAVARVIESKQLFKITAGPYKETENFEKEMRELLGVDHAVAMTSGLAALTCALIGMGIGPGDEVIVPAYTYIASATAVLSTGAIPVVAEIDETLMIDPEDIERKITDRTKAIIPVHMVGYAADMDKVMAVAKKHNLMVLEDSCQAVGGTYKGKHLGTFGDAGAFSFNYFKVISAGEGGAMLTNNKEIFEKGLIYHDCCAVAYFGNQMQDFSTPVFCGTEYRTNEISSAIMRVQLSRLDGILADLKRNRDSLVEKIKDHFNLVKLTAPDSGCATHISILFDSPEEALDFDSRTIAFYAAMGKHVYNAWDIMLEKRGAAHPLMNPYNMEANKGATEFTKDSCQKSLDIITRCEHITINPDWTEEDIVKVANDLIQAKKDMEAGK